MRENNRVSTLQTPKRHRSDKPYVKMDEISNKGSIFSSISCPSHCDRILKSWPKFLWITSALFLPKTLPNLSSFWLRQTADSTPPLFTPRL